MERRWSPSELSGGKFSEIVYTILDGHASGPYAAARRSPPAWQDLDMKRVLDPKMPLKEQIREQLDRLWTHKTRDGVAFAHHEKMTPVVRCTWDRLTHQAAEQTAHHQVRA